jgi:hypothetical protein
MITPAPSSLIQASQTPTTTGGWRVMQKATRRGRWPITTARSNLGRTSCLRVLRQRSDAE